MPQIAQQDYIRIAPKKGRALMNDMAAVARIVGLIGRGTIMDAILMIEDGYPARCIAYSDKEITFFDSPNLGEVRAAPVDYTVEQYEGLSAIQLAEDDYFGEVVITSPMLVISETFLRETEQAALICVDDCKLVPTVSAGKLTALSISQDKVDPDNDDFVNITWEDAQKLIGLPINQ